MALDLTMTVVVDATQAKAELAQVERGVRKVETAGKGAQDQVTKTAQAITGYGGQADRVTKSTEALDAATRAVTQTQSKFGQELRKEIEAQKAAESAAKAHTEALAGMGLRLGVIGAALLAFLAVGVAEVRFLKDSISLYLEKSGTLEKHEGAIDRVREAWERMQFVVGQVLLGFDVDFRWFFRLMEGGVNHLSGVLIGFVARFRAEMEFVASTLSWVAQNIPGGRQGLALLGMGADYVGSAAGDPQAAERARIARLQAARQREMETGVDNALARLQAQWTAEDYQKALEREKRIAAALKWAQQTRPGLQLGLSGQVGAEIPIGSLGALGGLQAMVNGPAGLLDPRYGTYRPYAPELIGEMSPSTLAWAMANTGYSYQRPGFWQRGFGDLGQFGAGVGQTVLGAVTGGGSILQGVGSYAGAGIGSAIAGGLTGTLGTVMGAVLPGIGALLGPALGWLGGKLFGPTDYEKRVRSEADQRRQITSGVDIGQLQQQAMLVGRTNLFEEFMRNRQGGDPQYLLQLLTEIEDRTTRLNAAMEKYGISWEDAGQAAKQSRIDAMGKELLLDFEVLAEAGFNVEFITEKMSGAMTDYLQTAIRTGTEVPFALKPIVQQMIDMGLLTDENGNAFASLEESGIAFAKTMTQGFESVVSAIDRVAKALGYVFDEFDGRTLHVGFDGPDIPGPGPDGQPGPPDREGGEYPSFATGTRGYEYFGTGTWARLHGWEKVTPMARGGREEYLLPVTLVAPDGEVLLKQVVRVAKLNGWT